MEFQIVKIDKYSAHQKKFNELLIVSNIFYKDCLKNRLESLLDPEYLQYLEYKFCGWSTNIKPTISKVIIGRNIPMSHTGGDKFNDFKIDNNYSDIYSKYLKQLRSVVPS